MSDRKEHYIVDEKGKRTAVVLPLKEYEDFLEHLRVGHGFKFSSGYGTDQDRGRGRRYFS